MPAYHEIARTLLDALGPGEKGALAGGVAVGAYGYVRATQDVDIVTDPRLRARAAELRSA